MTHPAVPLALARLSDKELHVRMVLDRGDTVAIIVENAQVRRHIIVEKIAGLWNVPDYIGGHGMQSPYERPMHAANPPIGRSRNPAGLNRTDHRPKRRGASCPGSRQWTQPLSDANAATMLAGWNPDQTWWLTDILRSTTTEPEKWHSTEDPNESEPNWHRLPT